MNRTSLLGALLAGVLMTSPAFAAAPAAPTPGATLRPRAPDVPARPATAPPSFRVGLSRRVIVPAAGGGVVLAKRSGAPLSERFASMRPLKEQFPGFASSSILVAERRTGGIVLVEPRKGAVQLPSPFEKYESIKPLNGTRLLSGTTEDRRVAIIEPRSGRPVASFNRISDPRQALGTARPLSPNARFIVGHDDSYVDGNGVKEPARMTLVDRESGAPLLPVSQRFAGETHFFTYSNMRPGQITVRGKERQVLLITKDGREDIALDPVSGKPLR